jgi:Mrp family chromosome partitioning ATPase
MARIREALRQADLNRGIAPAPLTAPHAYQPEEEPFSEPNAEEECPYIEVGAKHGPIDASPSVLAAAPAGKMPAKVKLLANTPTAPASTGERSPPRAVHGLVFRSLPSEPPKPGPVETRFAPELVALHRPQDPLNECFRTAVAAMAGQLPANQPQALLFTSLNSASESSDLLLNLAITRARSGRRVIALDTQFEQPLLAERLGLSAWPGLADVLAGAMSLQRAVRETGFENLYVLTAGRCNDDSHLLLAGEAMRAVLRHLRTRFDWILVDAPCWDGRPEVVALGSACDAVYVILPREKAETQETKKLLQLIPQQGSRLRGWLLTES